MRRLLINLLKAPITAYRYVISPWLGPRCRFVPSCSVYALEALEIHGPARGLLLTVKRLLKCHPLCDCPRHDPVPEKNAVRQWVFDWRRVFRYNRVTPK